MGYPSQEHILPEIEMMAISKSALKVHDLFLSYIRMNGVVPSYSFNRKCCPLNSYRLDKWAVCACMYSIMALYLA